MDTILNKPGIYTIPAGFPFLQELKALLLTYPPKERASITLYLPYRRAKDELIKLLLKAYPNILLPQIIVLGAIDSEDPSIIPPIPHRMRQGLLAQLILKYQQNSPTGEQACVVKAIQLAVNLIHFIDQAQGEALALKQLETLVPDRLAQHWQLTLDFLKIILQHWPHILHQTGYQDPHQAYAQTVDQQIRRWKENPPTHPVIAAGSTGSMPATRRLLKAIASLEQGTVILSGLEPSLTPVGYTHPQSCFTDLLKTLKRSFSDIPSWPRLQTKLSPQQQSRICWFQNALTPERRITFCAKSAVQSVTYIPCHTPTQEGRVISLLLRHTLQNPAQHALVVSPDPILNYRICQEMARWNIKIHNSAGTPLSLSKAGCFLQMILDIITTNFAPVPLLAFLKHPYTAYPAQEVWQIEKVLLRGVRLQPGLEGLIQAADLVREEVWQARFSHLKNILSPLMTHYNCPAAPLNAFAQCHAQAAQKLHATLWDEEGGQLCYELLEDLQNQGGHFPPLPGSGYTSFFQSNLCTQFLPPHQGGHPRLRILSPREARLIHEDTIILAGLNAGQWPPAAEVDPWLNRPMRATLGLPLPEKRIALANHDFGQLFSTAQQIFLTRSCHANGAPTRPSDLLLRLENALQIYGQALPREAIWNHWADALDAPQRLIAQDTTPPRPPIKFRPRRLSVTQIELWRRNPYALYAQHILKLSPLNPLNADPDQAQWGSWIHRLLDRFIATHKNLDSPDSLDHLLAMGEKILQPIKIRTTIHTFWWARFQNIAQWFLHQERKKRKKQGPYQTITEVAGALILNSPHGPFQLNARADRIDIFPDHTVDIIDYKTGKLPTESAVQKGLAPQLTLEGAIAQQGQFIGMNQPSYLIRSLQFWHLHGTAEGGSIKNLEKTCPNLLSRGVIEDLKNLVNKFDQVETAYDIQDSRNLPSHYAHLSRVDPSSGRIHRPFH